MDIKNNTFIKKYEFWIIPILIIVLVLTSKPYYENYNTELLRREYKEKELADTKLLDSLKTVLKNATKTDKEIIYIDNGYKIKYKDEYNKRIKAEKELNSIKYRIYDRAYLDSLSKHIEFR